jgi:hypothetical protein
VRSVGAWLLALALAGCAPITLSPAPASPPPLVRRAGPVAVAQATHEYPAPAVRQTASGGAGDPVNTVVAFATAYINWTSGTIAADMRTLAQHSIGQARSVAQLAATQSAGDYELARAGVANQGSVQAIGPVAGHADEYAVVTLERTTATASTAYEGLAAAWHVAVATVTQVSPGRWVVSGWQPEN